MKAFLVDNILTDEIRRESFKFNPRDFPRFSKETLQEAGKPLPRKHLDILVGNPDLTLKPVCETGFGCQDCAQQGCLHRSKFRSGYIPLGSFGKDKYLVNSVKHVALNKISPPILGLFFQGEALGVSPVARSTHCKLKMAEC